MLKSNATAVLKLHAAVLTSISFIRNPQAFFSNLCWLICKMNFMEDLMLIWLLFVVKSLNKEQLIKLYFMIKSFSCTLFDYQNDNFVF